MTTRLRLLTVLAAAAAGAFAVLPGPGGGATLVPGCADQVLERPFLPWLDPAHYVLAPDGGLEAGGARWTSGGGAAVAFGNESFYVRSPGDRLALRLPPGSWAQTPPMCVSLLHPTLRFFARGGAQLSPLFVDVVFRDSLGVMRSLPVGAALPSAAWSPTLPFAYLINATALPVAGDTVSVSFRFRPAGGVGWWIDDVYVDPYKAR